MFLLLISNNNSCAEAIHQPWMRRSSESAIYRSLWWLAVDRPLTLASRIKWAFQWLVVKGEQKHSPR